MGEAAIARLAPRGDASPVAAPRGGWTLDRVTGPAREAQAA